MVDYLKALPAKNGLFCVYLQKKEGNQLMKVFIAGLPLEVNEAELSAVFGDFGPVKSLRIIKDRETKESKGFGFVEMVNEDEAKEAIRCMNGQSYYGRRITVNVAEDKGFNSGGGFRRN